MKLFHFGMGDEWVGQTVFCVCAETEEEARRKVTEYVAQYRAEYGEGNFDYWPDAFSKIEVFESGEVDHIDID